jgi:hypothetical protein
MSEIFDGLVEIQNAGNKSTIKMDGNKGHIFAGGNGSIGGLVLKYKNEEDIIIVDGQGKIFIGGNGVLGKLILKNTIGGETNIIDGAGNIFIGGNGADGDLYLRNHQNKERIHMHESGTVEIGGNGADGDIYLRGANNEDRIHLQGSGIVEIGGNGVLGKIILKNTIGGETNIIDGAGNIFIGGNGADGDLYLRNHQNKERIHMHESGTVEIGGNGADGNIQLFDAAGISRIKIDGHAGDIILSGADCAEEFDVSEIKDIDPGTVMVIDDDCKLRPSEKPFDKRVAGIVSGGNRYRPGIILDNNPSQSKRLPIALSGKVYCKVDANYAPIEGGDLLTTSPTRGHAMKAVDPLKSFGAVIGKALCPLEGGRNQIPILVALQ